MDDQQLLRYSRHLLLPEIDIPGQEKLTHSSVFILGAGGLGSPAALYLAASGVGKLTICDHDQVDLTNLQRQILHETASIGKFKTDSARNTLQRINPEIEIISLPEQATARLLNREIKSVDAVIDASDNFSTRHLINQACLAHRKPLISAAAVRFTGQITVFDLRHPDSPCYHCLFPDSGDSDDPACAIMGVFSPLTGIIGCIQAAETIKVLLGIGETLHGRLLLLDGLTMHWRSLKLSKDPQCPTCHSASVQNLSDSQ
ncbi:MULTISPECIES: HesA/MoeB/ThiF family protein [Nitrosomonas]|uniref:HesA/MoeB/ThiF family protein n=1 Tax=Nitrosomonas TaxID=914 RepID=UPI000796F976|nr:MULTISPECIES: HesA/MoeB/ThiF family protein [Nitrosomonas]KXK35494.1 MAG: NAD binding site:UBA/THIF-type NAD/FAD binding fold protein [Nitrosomonas europaea]MEB2332155.1 HesA/MoeB/ThiF family protein [Nitrosomonas sp.]QOJ08264.1 MAG: HesA/MoeB/ThiF family protein [Nitrosomonas sp. H1_AOB3]HNS58450.1 HesA/MoeB/ThiF family protein [Nitrosomonas europaea]HRN81761.1 HesA/MoeB/ThiF family protein [Nitrosomonas europaea]